MEKNKCKVCEYGKTVETPTFSSQSMGFLTTTWAPDYAAVWDIIDSMEAQLRTLKHLLKAYTPIQQPIQPGVPLSPSVAPDDYPDTIITVSYDNLPSYTVTCSTDEKEVNNEGV